MATTYTNNQKLVTDALMDLLWTEFNPMPVSYSNTFDQSKMRLGKYLRFWLTDSEMIGFFANGENRNYNFELVWYWQDDRKEIKQIADNLTGPDIERTVRLLNNNSSYINGDSVYCWHYLEIDYDNIPLPIAEIDDLETEKRGFGARLNITIYRANIRGQDG